MAGFKGRSFHLKRNEVPPLIELQQKIFPFVETASGGPGSEAFEEWKQDCINEMNEVGQNEPTHLRQVVPRWPSSTKRD
ncbi:hypothetical protein BGX26_006736, partial [Mortierella sp. AD094]